MDRAVLNSKQAASTMLYKRRSISGQIMRDRWMYLMMIPGLLYFVIFKILPMWGVLISFQNYQPFLGFFGSKWVGFTHFHRLFTDPMFLTLFRNTMVLAVYNLIFFFPMPIILALLLHEVKRTAFKRYVQSTIYIPHFISWVVVVGIVYVFFSSQDGIFTNWQASLHHGNKTDFMASTTWFRTMITGEVIWKDSGWGTILFLAALAGVDPQMYEAARIDGANRWRQVWHITLPSIRAVIVILLILRLGHFLETGFEQIYLMLNGVNREVGEVFDTYVYSFGITQGQFSYSTAVGLFKSVVSFILVLAANHSAKRIGEEGIF